MLNKDRHHCQLNWNKLPIIIQWLLTKIEDLHKYNTRQAKTTKLFLPRVSKQMEKISSSSFSSFFIARFSVRVAWAVAQD